MAAETVRRRFTRAVTRELPPMLRLSTPVVVAEMGWIAMQIVDIGMVGRLGPEAIGAVGVGSTLFLALAVSAMGLLLGLDTFVSRAHGAGRGDECRVWLRHGLVLAAALSVPVTGLAWLAVGWLPAWGLNQRVLDQAGAYFGTVAWSALPLLLYFALRRYLQAVDRVQPVMVALVSANLVNAAVNWLLVFGNLGFPRLGVEGAAWATCVSRAYLCLTLAGTTWHVGHGDRTFTPRAGWFGIEAARLRRLLALGWPAAGQLVLEIGVFAAATALAGRLAATQLAAHQIVLNLASLTFMVPLGVSTAGAVRVGQAVGRADGAGTRRAGWVALGVGAVFMGMAALGFVAVPRPILRLFTSDPAVVEVGTALLLVAALFQLFDGLQVVATGVLRGLGDTRVPMLSNLVGHWILGLPVGYALCFGWDWGVVGLWVGLSMGLILVGVVLVPVWHYRARTV